jgi:hypothetical protein
MPKTHFSGGVEDRVFELREPNLLLVFVAGIMLVIGAPRC